MQQANVNVPCFLVQDVMDYGSQWNDISKFHDVQNLRNQKLEVTTFHVFTTGDVQGLQQVSYGDFMVQQVNVLVAHPGSGDIFWSCRQVGSWVGFEASF